MSPLEAIVCGSFAINSFPSFWTLCVCTLSIMKIT
jgi:hypothetical protein